VASVVRALLACALLVGTSACTAAYRISHRNRAREQPAAEAWFARSDNKQIAAGVVREPYVPRIYCFDGTLSLTCTPDRTSTADCCPNQGGVYRDRWGNVVAQ
jgi:hypothetical protein